MTFLRMVNHILILYYITKILFPDSPRFNSHAWHIFELDPCDGQGRVCLVYNSVCN